VPASISHVISRASDAPDGATAETLSGLAIQERMNFT
jgi:hypothetical protein